MRETKKGKMALTFPGRAANASLSDVYPALFMSQSMQMMRLPRCNTATKCVLESVVGSGVMPPSSVNVLHIQSSKGPTSWTGTDQPSAHVSSFSSRWRPQVAFLKFEQSTRSIAPLT